MVLTWVTVASELSSTVVLYSGPVAHDDRRHVPGAGRHGCRHRISRGDLLIVFTVLPVALLYRLLRRHELGMM